MNSRHTLLAAGIFAASLSALSPMAMAGDFTLSSPTLVAQGFLPTDQVFNGFGCTGKNISPALIWRDAPSGTRSFAVTVFDPDAPTDSGWWHWLVVNLPASSNGLTAAAGDPSGEKLPTGATQVRTDFGQAGFGGACPPAGDKPHRYIFTVYALKASKIELPVDASAAFANSMIRANAIGKASLTMHYGR